MEERHGRVVDQDDVEVAPPVVRQDVDKKVENLEERIEEQVRKCDEDEVEDESEVAVVLHLGPSFILPFLAVHRAQSADKVILDLTILLADVVLDSVNSIID